MDQLNPMVRRARAAQATLDAFKDKPFKWGTRDCARLAAFHVRKLGYRVKLPPSGSYRTLLGATKALRAAGFASVGEALDSLGFQRIAPAAAIVGNVIELPSEDALGAIGVVLGNGRVAGYHPDVLGAVVVQPIEFVAAWRVDPR